MELSFLFFHKLDIIDKYVHNNAVNLPYRLGICDVREDKTERVDEHFFWKNKL